LAAAKLPKWRTLEANQAAISEKREQQEEEGEKSSSPAAPGESSHVAKSAPAVYVPG